MNDPSAPLISAVIPARNEMSRIDRCLHSVFSADPIPGGFEVLVVDGMSDDGTRRILASWCQKHPNLRILNNPARIVPSAMNIGIRAARGKWIIRLDAHSEYPANYFTLCMDTIRRTGADNVGGAVTTLVQNEKWQGTIIRVLTTHWFGVGNSGFRTEAREGWADTVPFGFYRRDIFSRIGLYDERLLRNQDYELNRRLLKTGGRIWYNPAIRVLYYNQSSLRGLFRQAFITGQWNPWMWFVAPYSFAWRHAIPMAFVGALLGTVLMFLAAPALASMALNLVLLPYITLAIGISLHQAFRGQGWLCLLLPLSFFGYHLAYGLGSLWGLCLLFTRQSPVQSRSEPQYEIDGLDPDPVEPHRRVS